MSSPAAGLVFGPPSPVLSSPEGPYRRIRLPSLTGSQVKLGLAGYHKSLKPNITGLVNLLIAGLNWIAQMKLSDLRCSFETAK